MSFCSKDFRMKTILAVDDNQDDLFLLERAVYLSGPGHLLFKARDGIQAQEMLENIQRCGVSTAIDIIFLDLHLPGAAGFELLARWKKIPRYASIPVVVISSFDNPRDTERALKLGAAACLEKPPAVEEVRRLLRTLIADVPQPCNPTTSQN